MYFQSFRLAALALLALFASGVNPAQAETLKEKIATLKLLPLQYGTNNLRVNGLPVLIVRGLFANGNAWGGDIYTVLVRHGKSWQMVRRYEQADRSSVLNLTLPHTYEDSIVSIDFMIPEQDTPENGKNLYMLEIKREYKGSPINTAPALFTLYDLDVSDNFGIFYLKALYTQKSVAEYCNADSAAYHELHIPLPGDGQEFACAGR